MKVIGYILLLLIGCGLNGCSTRCDPYLPPPPMPVYFEVMKDGKILPDSILRNTRLYFDERNALKSYDGSLEVSYPAHTLNGQTTYDSSKPLLRTQTLSTAPYHNIYDRFHLEYPNLTTDTFSIDYEQRQMGESKCGYIQTSIKQINYNGYYLKVDSTLFGYTLAPVYIINK